MKILFSIREGKKFGFIDATGKAVIPPRFQNDQFRQHHEGAVDFSDWVPIKQGGGWGYIDQSGDFVIEPRFAAASRFSEDLAAFGGELVGRSYGIGTYRWGYIDRAGKTMIEPRFGKAGEFADGLTIVSLPDADGKVHEWSGEAALIDRQGQIVSRGFEALFSPCQGRMLAWKDGARGYLDARGEVAVPFTFDQATHFCEDRARVTKGSKMQVIDRTGRVVFDCQASPPLPSYGPWYREHVGVSSEGMLLDLANNKAGFRDRDGRGVIDYAFDDAVSFSEGLAAVKVAKKWGFVDKLGKMIIEPRFEEPSFFSEGRAHAKVKIKVGAKTVTRFGFIDAGGEMVIEPQFTKADERPVLFQHGLAAVVRGKRRCYIDRAGAIVWQE